MSCFEARGEDLSRKPALACCGGSTFEKEFNGVFEIGRS